MDIMKIVQNMKSLPLYEEALRKISLNSGDISEEEKSFLLSCAIILLKKYDTNRHYTSFVELAYFIILKYSLQFKDYEPLYDFSVNMGFYPIAQVITNSHLLAFDNIPFSLVEKRIRENFSRREIIETREQRESHNAIIKSEHNEISFVAPTSFGKSSIIVDHMMAHADTIHKAGIIVPTKSLLMQTYRTIRDSSLNKKILIHDEMYTNEDEFIAVFTQERALRLLEKHELSFDALYIDEAHRLLERDSRSILLSRLIRINRTRNKLSRTIYLSPLVSDSNNLKLSAAQNIFEQRIVFTIKEPDYFEYRLDHSVYKYNRFVDDFYFCYQCPDIFSYILSQRTAKSFCYLYAPKKIELFAKELANHCGDVGSSIQIQEIIHNLCKYVHDDFYAIDYLKKGIVYLHGKMPDNVKEYLEYKYSQVREINFLIANKVVLEGINLPIDSLFVLNTYNLQGKDLTNLIGRVNRLDQIFNPQSPNLQKLCPTIHFINSEEYNRVRSNMQAKIRLLKCSITKDDIKNPLLAQFDFSQFDSGKNEVLKEKCKEIASNEDVIFTVSSDPIQLLKKKMISLGMSSIYVMSDDLCNAIIKRIEHLLAELRLNEIHILDKLQYVFVRELEGYIQDYEFVRLKDSQAITYYKMFLDRRKKSLKENVTLEVVYFEKRSKSNDSRLYVGSSYGEIPYEAVGANSHNNVYIDLKRKSRQQLTNIAIVKQKMEEDFVGFKLHMFFQLMLDYELITQDDYNLFVHGTTNQNKLSLAKTGLSINIINRLEDDKQLQNIYIDDNNNLHGNQHFYNYKAGVDDFYRFELSKFL